MLFRSAGNGAQRPMLPPSPTDSGSTRSDSPLTAAARSPTIYCMSDPTGLAQGGVSKIRGSCSRGHLSDQAPVPPKAASRQASSSRDALDRPADRRRHRAVLVRGRAGRASGRLWPDPAGTKTAPAYPSLAEVERVEARISHTLSLRGAPAALPIPPPPHARQRRPSRSATGRPRRPAVRIPGGTSALAQRPMHSPSHQGREWAAVGPDCRGERQSSRAPGSPPPLVAQHAVD